MKMSLLLYVYLFFQIQSWTVYQDNEAAISVDFPSKPFTQEKIIKTDLGETMLKTVYLPSNTDSTENTLYLVNYYKFDNIIFFGDSAVSQNEYLESALDNIKNSLDGDLLYANPTSDKGCPAIIYRLELDKNKVMKGKLLLTGNYLYSLQVFSTANYSLNKNMDKFLNSFTHKKCD